MEEGKKIFLRGESGIAAWETIYCSLVLILVAFFAMLASYSKSDTKQMTYFMQKINFLEDPDLSATLAIKSLKRYFKNAGLDKSSRIEMKKKGFKAIFESHVFFLPGLATINKAALPFLDEVIKIARKGNFSVTVEGHTDNVPINTPKFPSNWELSTARAGNVLQYLFEKGELPAERLFAAGFGQYHPVESNDTPEDRQKNRRVEFYFKLSS